MRDIKKMLNALGEAASKFGRSYIGRDNAPAPCFQLPKDLTLTLVAGYRVVLRKKIIDLGEPAPKFGGVYIGKDNA